MLSEQNSFPLQVLTFRKRQKGPWKLFYRGKLTITTTTFIQHVTGAKLFICLFVFLSYLPCVSQNKIPKMWGHRHGC